MHDRSSFTAATVALQRAFESSLPPAARLFEDPHAEAFTRGSLRLLARASRLPAVGGLAPRLYDAVAGPGPRPSAVARTRLIDDLVSETDAGQVAILGAGFDTRAYRLPALAGRRVFEVDHPATQATKRAVVERLGLAAEHVVHVPVDFERDSLDGRLLAAGFDPNRETLFVWEGVTNYLTAEAVDATLRIVRALAPAGGTLVFTYVEAGALDGSVHFPEAARWLRGVRRAGEPWTFGLAPAGVPAFLQARGYVLESDVSTHEAGERWFPARGRRDRGSALYHVVVARIVPCRG